MNNVEYEVDLRDVEYQRQAGKTSEDYQVFTFAVSDRTLKNRLEHQLLIAVLSR